MDFEPILIDNVPQVPDDNLEEYRKSSDQQTTFRQDNGYHSKLFQRSFKGREAESPTLIGSAQLSYRRHHFRNKRNGSSMYNKPKSALTNRNQGIWTRYGFWYAGYMSRRPFDILASNIIGK